MSKFARGMIAVVAIAFLVFLMVLWAKSYGFQTINDGLHNIYEEWGWDAGFYFRDLNGNKYTP